MHWGHKTCYGVADWHMQTEGYAFTYNNITHTHTHTWFTLIGLFWASVKHMISCWCGWFHLKATSRNNFFFFCDFGAPAASDCNSLLTAIRIYLFWSYYLLLKTSKSTTLLTQLNINNVLQPLIYHSIHQTTKSLSSPAWSLSPSPVPSALVLRLPTRLENLLLLLSLSSQSGAGSIS